MRLLRRRSDLQASPPIRVRVKVRVRARAKAYRRLLIFWVIEIRMVDRIQVLFPVIDFHDLHENISIFETIFR